MPAKPKPRELLSSLKADSNGSDELMAYIVAFGLRGNATEKRHMRDKAIRELAAMSSGSTRMARAKSIAANLRRYESTMWKTDSELAMPLETFSVVRKARFWALRYNGDRSLAYRKIFEIIDKI